MTYILYADVMLLWSFFINLGIICITSKILDVKKRFKKNVIWSLTTAALTELEFIITLNQDAYLHHTLYSAIYIFMFYLYFKNILNLIYIIGAIAFSCIIIAGVLMISDSPPDFLQSIILIIFSVILATIMKKNKNDTNRINCLQPITLAINNKSIECNGYIDTGNTLRDPYSSSPVIVIDYRIMHKLFDKNILKYINDYHQSGYFDYEAINQLTGLKFYPILYKTISKSISLMPVFKIEKLTYLSTKKSYTNVAAGISRYTFGDKKNYQVLLNESLKPNREEYSND